MNIQGWMNVVQVSGLADPVYLPRAKTSASEARAHGSAKISVRRWAFSTKWGPKNSKKGLSSQAMGIMRLMAGDESINPL